MDKLLYVSLEGAVLAGIVFLIKALGAKRLSKSFLYYIWLPVLLRLLLPVGFEVGVIPKSVPEPAPYMTVERAEPYEAPIIITSAPVEVEAAPTVRSFDWHSLIIPAYAALSAGIFLFHARAYFVFLRRLKSGLEYVLTSGRLKVYLSKTAETPMQVGVLRPMIVLPKRHYEREELDLILAHETVHWQRRDLVIKWLMLAARSLHWFNPVVYFISRDLDRSCEMSCDEAVCRSLDEVGRMRYGETLIYMASAARLPVRVPAATLVENKKALKARIIAIRDYKKVTIVAVCAMVVLAAVLCACSAIIPGEKQEDEIEVVDEPVVVELAETTDESEAAAVAALKDHVMMFAHKGTNAVVEYEVLGSEKSDDGMEYLIVYMLSEYSPYSKVYIYGDAKAAKVTGSGRTAYIEFFDTRDELADILSAPIDLDSNRTTAKDYRNELKARANADLSTENNEWYAPENYSLTTPSEDYKRISELTDEQVIVMFLNCYDSYDVKARNELWKRMAVDYDAVKAAADALSGKPYRGGDINTYLEPIFTEFDPDLFTVTDKGGTLAPETTYYAPGDAPEGSRIYIFLTLNKYCYVRQNGDIITYCCFGGDDWYEVRNNSDVLIDGQWQDLYEAAKTRGIDLVSSSPAADVDGLPDFTAMQTDELCEYYLKADGAYAEGSAFELYRRALSDPSGVLKSIHSVKTENNRAVNTLLAPLIFEDLENRPAGAFGGALYNEFMQLGDEAAEMYVTAAISKNTIRLTASEKYEEDFPTDGVRVTYDPDDDLFTVINKDGSRYESKIILGSSEKSTSGNDTFFIAYNGKQAGVYNQTENIREITVRKNETLILTAESELISADGKFNWSSSDDSILKVNEGKITGIAKGIAVLVLRSGDLSDSILVRVTE